VCSTTWFAWETDVRFGCSLFLFNCWMTTKEGEMEKRMGPENFNIMGSKKGSEALSADNRKHLGEQLKFLKLQCVSFPLVSLSRSPQQ
jgi:hypothetical protein